VKYRRILYGVIALAVVLVGIHFLTSGKNAGAPQPGVTTPAPATESATGSTAEPTNEPTAEPTSGPTTTAAAGTAVPSVVGHRLTNALQELLGDGFADVLPVDAAGQKIPVNPENWIVEAQDPAAGVVSSLTTRVRLTVSKPEETPDTGGGGVPDVVCSGLPDATTALTQAGYTVATRDGTGRGRLVLVDSNWLVIAQSAQAGSHPSRGAQITVTIVKFGEPTGASGCHS
jgi:hypothetical protein